MKRALPAALLLLAVLAAGIWRRASEVAAQRHEAAVLSNGGNPDRGRTRIEHWGCVACHEIPGVGPREGRVGPDLSHIAGQLYLAGAVPNTGPNLIAWIRNARQFAPHSVMPPFPASDADLRDIAAYLETLK